MNKKEKNQSSLTQHSEARSNPDSKKVHFHADTPEELAKVMDGLIPEKDLQNIMGLVNSVTGAEHINSFTTQKTDNENNIQKNIVLIKTNDSTRLIPVLTNSNVHLDVSLDVTTSDCHDYQDDNNIDFQLSSNIIEMEGVLPMIVIPHIFNGNDNEDAISKVIDFLLTTYSENITIDPLECHGIGVTGKIIKIIKN